MVIADLPLVILIANDSKADTSQLRAWLVGEQPGHRRVETVQTGADALARCRDEPPACLLLCDHLPDMSCSEVLAALPRAAGLTAFPVLVITTSAAETATINASQFGVEDCLTRDQLSASLLQSAVRGAIERHRLQQQLAETQLRLSALDHAASHGRAEASEASARARSDLLAEAGRRLAESLEPIATLATVTQLLVPAVANLCIVDLFRDDGAVERAAVVHADPARADLAAGLQQYPPDLTRAGVAEALRTGRAECEPVVTDAMLVRIARDDHHLALLRKMGVESHMRVPLVARGRVLGSLLLVSTEGWRRYGADDQATAEELAARCALALDNARLHTAEEQARRRATALADATRALTEVSSTPVAVLPLVARQAATLVGDLAVLRLLSADGRWLEPVAVDHPNPATRAEARAALAGERHGADQGANGTGLRTGLPMRVDREALGALRQSSDPSLWPPMRQSATETLLAVPLRVEGHGIGTLSVSRASTDRPYDDDDERFLQELADRAALAIERARLFADVQASEERFRSIFERAGTGIAIMDLDGRFVQCNPAYAAMLGSRPERLTNVPFVTLVHPDDRAVTATQISRLPTGDHAFFETETRYLHDSGATVWVHTVVSTLRDGLGTPTHLVMLVTDITERRQAETERAALLAQEQLARSDAEAAVRARDQFLSIAAHELRTPTTGIKGYAQVVLRLLRRGVSEPDRLVHGLHEIMAATDRLAALIDDLLDVARLQSGQLRLRSTQIDLTQIIDGAVERHRTQPTGNQRLVFEPPADPALVMGDAGRIQQVVDNLLSNALKYSPGGGVVRIAISAEASGMALTVMDDGIGLPSGAAESIFRPFGRAANATTQNLPGMGLGLYISRQIVEAHGGQISAESKGEGLGTTFTVWLPASLERLSEVVPTHLEIPADQARV